MAALRVGVIGAGGMGNVHTRHYKNIQGVEIKVFDVDSERLGVFGNRHGIESASTLEELLSWCDLADICLPTDLHHKIGLQAIAAGRHVLIEKPLAKTIEEAAELIEAADKGQVILMPGQVVRFFREYAGARRLVESGKIGKPAAARARRGGLAPQGGAGNWFMDHHRSGGVLIDLAIHEFDWLRWTLGEVKHLYSKSLGTLSMQGPDYALTTLSFDNGAVAHVESTWMDPSGFRATFEICGSQGMIEHDSRASASLKTHAGGKTFWEAPLSPSDDPFFNQLYSLVSCIKHGTPPPTTAKDGFMALSIALAAVESAKSGRVTVPSRG